MSKKKRAHTKYSVTPACFLFECPPSLVAGLRRLRGRSTMRRPSPRRRSSSCCSCFPPTRRPSRRRVASVSSQTKQPQPHKETARSGAAAAATSARRQPDAASDRPVGPNSAQRRSAARSAQHHAQLQLRFYRTAIAVLYFCRLRRRCRLRTNLADLESLESGSVHEGSGALPMFSSAPLGASSSKRADRPPSSASSSVASGASSSSSDALHGGFYRAQRPPMLLGPGEPRKQPRKAPPAPPYAGRM